MTKIDIFSGFLGAGKTTLIKKLINEAYKGEKLVLIENEFGEIGIDGGFLKEAGIEITEMNSGCICCSLVGDFSKALEKVLEEYEPDRIIIEPSGVGKLSDVIKATEKVTNDEVVLNSFVTVVDSNKCKVYMKNFGEFFGDQISNAGTVILSRTDIVTPEKLSTALEIIKGLNHDATVITTPIGELDGKQILNAMEKSETLERHIHELEEEHHHHEHGEHCHCHEHHHHDEECHCHDHEHHHHGEECHCHDHEHHHHDEGRHFHGHEHHHHDEECHCHNHEHHHHADDVFTSWGIETASKFTKEQLEEILNSFDNEEKFGTVLRAKGIVAANDGTWLHFDYVPGESEIRTGSADVTGRLCVIGSKINTSAIEQLFN